VRIAPDSHKSSPVQPKPIGKAFSSLHLRSYKCNDAFMKLAMRSLSLLAIVTCLTYAAFGDESRDCYNSGIAKRQTGDLDGALADFNKAIELKPDYSSAYVARGTVKKQKGDLDGALADLSQSIVFDPKNADAYDRLASAELAKGDVTSAWVHCNRAIELKPDYYFAYSCR
jgi:tetratricopeptide (TPR) repeat protein